VFARQTKVRVLAILTQNKRAAIVPESVRVHVDD
jgi:hypothetical protein